MNRPWRPDATARNESRRARRYLYRSVARWMTSASISAPGVVSAGSLPLRLPSAPTSPDPPSFGWSSAEGANLEALLRVARALGVLDDITQALDPYRSDVGRQRADEQLPQRVRRRSDYSDQP